ncbi:DMSO/selenate family reductase complex A subunit [Raoultibacter timonensis]|uniref:DMSO/selenate family reductase complex A subunit n=1 Tax=Raoultibacter timonensis TaxID=1907662 RepID=UPI0026DACEB8|nr:DMSO/selenate family reductase complex A subunit [Raoultibacter timonensis]
MNDAMVSRRGFVKGSALAGLGVAVAGGGAFSLFGCSSQGEQQTGASEPTESAEQVFWGHCSVNCEGRCSLQLHVKDDEVVWVESDNTGDDEYGNHQIRACLRGRSIRRWINHPDRLSVPMKRVGKRGEGKFEQISWDEAFDMLAENYTRILDEYGPESIWNHYASGVNASNIGSFLSRFINMNGGCLGRYGSYSSAQISAALPYLYGTRAANSNSDIVNSKLVVMFGENSVETKAGGAGPTYHLEQALEQGGAKVIVIDPRYSDTVATRADQWIPIRPGTDAALVDAVAYVLISEDLVDHDFLAKYCIGYDEDSMPESAKGQNKSYKAYIMGEGADAVAKTPAWAEAITGVAADTITELAREIGTAKPCAIYQGKGPQRQSNGEQTARAICMLPVLTGNVGINGGNTGSDLDGFYFSTFSVPTGDNPVETKIATFTWTDAIDHGTDMTKLANGVRGKDKLEVPIKMIFNYAGNTITNQHSDINRTHEILQDESKCEFIVVWDTFLTDSAKYADLLLPDLMPVEQPNFVSNDYAGNMGFIIMGQPVTSPKFERKTLYSVLSEVADRMGMKDEFTEGRDEQAWLEYCYEEARKKDSELPTFEEMLAQGIYRRKDPDGHHVALKDFRDDPEANPLETPSGKIEIYSEALEEIVATWELAEGDIINPLPVYAPGVEGFDDPLRETYPLQMPGYHYKARAHSSYGCIDVLKQAAPQELWINPVDAESRGIADGETVKVYNDRGTVEILAKVTPRILPGVVSMGQGAWHEADMAGDKVDRGGCINTLTSLRPTPLAKANPQHTNLVEVAKL